VPVWNQFKHSGESASIIRDW